MMGKINIFYPILLEHTLREKYLWGMIYKNWIANYETELSWIRQIRQEFQQMEAAHQWAKS